VRFFCPTGVYIYCISIIHCIFSYFLLLFVFLLYHCTFCCIWLSHMFTPRLLYIFSNPAVQLQVCHNKVERWLEWKQDEPTWWGCLLHRWFTSWVELYSAIYTTHSLKVLRYGSHSLACKLHHVCLCFISVHQMAPPLTEVADIHLLTLKGWKTEFAWLADL